MEPRTPISLITGSLGSGKTTLLRRILENSNRRIAVLMNEFGELAIDSQIIKGESIEIIELAGGCVCCSMTGEFEAAVREIVDRIQPELIVVEATGVAEADALVYEVEDSLPEVRLDSVICIVDAYLSVKYPHVGYTARTQLSAADILLINKIDLVTTDEVKGVEQEVRKYNDTAVIFKTVGCDIDVNLLFGLDVERRPLPTKQHGEAELQSFTYTTDAALDEARFRDFIDDLPPEVYRAKGFVRFDGNGTGHLFNYVVGRADLETFEADRVQLVFIGRHLEDVKASLLDRLRRCEAKSTVKR